MKKRDCDYFNVSGKERERGRWEEEERGREKKKLYHKYFKYMFSQNFLNHNFYII